MRRLATTFSATVEMHIGFDTPYLSSSVFWHFNRCLDPEANKIEFFSLRSFLTSGRRDGFLSPMVLLRLAGQELGLDAQDHRPLGTFCEGSLKCVAGFPQPYSQSRVIHLFILCGPAIVLFNL